MLLAVKFFIAVLIFFSLGIASAKDVYLLVLKEAIPKNCEAINLGDTEGLYQVGLDTREVSGRLPLSWSGCMDFGFLAPLRKKMIESGMAERVIVMQIEIAGSNLRDWEAGGRFHVKLKSALVVANSHNIKFDYALWQGRFIPANFDRLSYVGDVRRLIKSISLSTKIDKWIIGLSASCIGENGAKTLPVQWAPLLNRFPGPDIGEFENVYYADRCNLNQAGQREIVHRWFSAMKKADIESNKYQKESLLYYFK